MYEDSKSLFEKILISINSKIPKKWLFYISEIFIQIQVCRFKGDSLKQRRRERPHRKA